MNWFLLSLIAILFGAAPTSFSKMGAKPEDTYSHWKMVMAVGVVMGLHAVFMIATGTPFSLGDIVTYLPASFCYITSMVIGYAGLRYIELSISSPVCNSSGAVAALLCFLVLGETMTGLQLFGVVLVCAGVFALSYIEKKGRRAPGGGGLHPRQKAHPQRHRHRVPPPLLCHRRPGDLCGRAAAGHRHRRGAGQYRL